MNAFGIEIRRTGQVSGFFSEVDNVLSRYGIPQGGVNADVQRTAVAHALQRMLQADHWFDVSCVRDCQKVCQVVISAERMAIYSTAHCMHWSAMLPDYRNQLLAMVLDDFRSVLEVK